LPTVAVEGVAGFVEVDRYVWMGVLDLLNIGEWYAAVFFSEMEDQRCERFLVEQLNNLSAVVTDRGINFQARSAQPRVGPAETVADDANFSGGRLGSSVRDGRRDVVQNKFGFESGRETPTQLDARWRIVEFCPSLNPIKQSGSHRKETVRCVGVSDAANMGIHTEDFLDDDESGGTFLLSRDVGGKSMPIFGG